MFFIYMMVEEGPEKNVENLLLFTGRDDKISGMDGMPRNKRHPSDFVRKSGLLPSGRRLLSFGRYYQGGG